MVTDDCKLAFVVPRHSVKRVKSALENHGQLNRALKIRPQIDTSTISDHNQQSFVIATELKAKAFSTVVAGASVVEKEEVLKRLDLADCADKISCVTYGPAASEGTIYPAKGNPLLRAAEAWLQSLSSHLWCPSLDVPYFLTSFPNTYTVYKPMLLLPCHIDRSQPWNELLTRLSSDSDQLNSLYHALASSVSATHIAANSPIPLQFPSSATESSQENVLRAPLALTPLYGDFGPPPSKQLVAAPTSQDFASAFWVEARQNHIQQTWAPLFTMFSRGNVTEKTRLLRLPSVVETAKQNEGTTAVDLYAGIGYFAFSYKRAGAKTVLCWELNPWSVEGLRRGARLNGWTVMVGDNHLEKHKDERHWNPSADLLVFQESNQYALSRIQDIRHHVPPITHVNCGLLPSSRRSWEMAVNIVDSRLGGWIHLHENVAAKDIDVKSKEILSDIQILYARLKDNQVVAGETESKLVRLEHVEKVKTYAPGVMHCVLDIYIPPTQDRIPINVL